MSGRTAGLASFALRLGLALALVARSSLALAITFEDGLVHVIDAQNSFAFEGVIVRDGPGGATTQVTVVDGGAIGSISLDDLELFDGSVVNILGGTLGRHVFARDSSVVHFSGGEIDRDIKVRGGAVLNTTGGLAEDLAASKTTPEDSSVRPTINLMGGSFSTLNCASAICHMSGGTIVFLFAQVDAEVTLSGGTIQTDATFGNGAPKGYVSGGEIQGRLFAISEATVTVTGGVVRGEFRILNSGVEIVEGGLLEVGLTASNSSLVDLSGGTVQGLLAATDEAVVTVHGPSFTIPFGDVVSTSGTLQGVLADGTPLDVPFGRATTATITLVQASAPPIPALPRSSFWVMALLLGGAVAAQRRCYRRAWRFATDGACEGCAG